MKPQSITCVTIFQIIESTKSEAVSLVREHTQRNVRAELASFP
jgi:hypothetical protein